MKKIKYINLIFLFIIIFISALNNIKADPGIQKAPKYVYRVEKQAPETIFKNGFTKYGNNDNLLEHVEGKTLYSGDRASAFTSTTRRKSAAEVLTRERLIDAITNNEYKELWIYKIRTSSLFYNAGATLKCLINNEPDLEKKEHIRKITGFYRHEKEWPAKTVDIKPSQIEYAIKAKYDPNLPPGQRVVFDWNNKMVNKDYKDTGTLPIAPYVYPNCTPKMISSKFNKLQKRNTGNDYNIVYVFKDKTLRKQLPPSFCDVNDKGSSSCNNLIPLNIKKLYIKETSANNLLLNGTE